jgi:tetratricopeptide (TPR) repeat protein
MSDAAPVHDLESALQIVESVQSDPRQAQAHARELIRGHVLDQETAAVAWWALGLAARQLNDLPAAEKAFRTGMDLAERAALSQRVGQIRSSLALVLLYQGDTRGALEEAEAASAALRGVDKARNEMQIGLILQRLGRMDEALSCYRPALSRLRRSGDRLAEARLLSNRGVLHGYRGELDMGVSDLVNATRIAEELGQHLIVAACAHNLGFLEGRRGDVPTALSWFDRAEGAYERLGRPPGMVEVLEANRAELLLSVGLVAEASETVRAAVAGLETSENRTDLSETRLLAAEVALADNRPLESIEAARVASAEFVEQDREAWHLLAEYALLRARVAAGDTEGRQIDRAARLVDRLVGSGLTAEAQHCQLLVGRIALLTGDLESARRHLRGASGARHRGPAVGRAQAWYAEALLRHAEGNKLGSTRAIDAGLRVIRDYRLSLGASELRSHAAAHGLDLAFLAVEKAMASGSPWSVLRAVESWRSESTHIAAARPPADPQLEGLLAELRRLDAEIREAGVSGHRTDRLTTAKTLIESEIKSMTRRLRGSAFGGSSSEWSRDGVIENFHHRRLVCYFTFDGDIHAVSVFDESIELTKLVDAERARTEVSSLLFALNRLAFAAGSQRSLESAETQMVSSQDQLRRMLLDPVSTGHEDLTLIPTGALHRLPWPGLAPGRAMSVAPSLESWMAATARATSLDQDVTALLVAGPRLPGAVGEIARIARLYRNRRRRTGRSAKANVVLEDIEGADVVHIAAHGSFRWDNPSFSSLEMDDGPLTVYDLEQIKSPPTVMILSSCDTGVSKVVAGDELLGLSVALINSGVSNLIAPVVPIPDAIAADVMAAIHRHLVAGNPASAALAKAIAQVTERGAVRERALCSSFVAFGA